MRKITDSRRNPSGTRSDAASDAAAAAAASGTEIFMRASLADLDPAFLDPDTQLPAWLFSLGALEAISRKAQLDPVQTVGAAVRFFGHFYALEPDDASALVGSLLDATDQPDWLAMRSDGERAMEDWLAARDAAAHERLGELLEAGAMRRARGARRSSLRVSSAV